MKKILLVATVQSHIAQFHKPLINWLHEQGYIVDVAARNNLAEKNNLHLDEPDNIYDIPFSRSPFSLKNIKAYKALKKVINDGGYDLVHCNTPVGGILTRMAANKLRRQGKVVVLYEAHGFHFFKGGSRKNWMIWYPIEKYFSKKTDVLVTINKMDYELASEKFKAKRVEHIPGVGLNLSQFMSVDEATNIKKELGLKDEQHIVLSVGELNKNKNHQVIIRAIAHLNDGNIHYVIAGNGPLREELEKLAKKLGVENQVHFLGYRRDIPNLFKAVDLLAFPSLREGLGMASIEAMSAGLPLVTSNRHGINDYSEDGKTGFKYNPNDYEGFAKGIKAIVYDEELKRQMGEYNARLSQNYTVEVSMAKLSKIYEEVLNNEQ